MYFGIIGFWEPSLKVYEKKPPLCCWYYTAKTYLIPPFSLLSVFIQQPNIFSLPTPTTSKLLPDSHTKFFFLLVFSHAAGILLLLLLYCHPFRILHIHPFHPSHSSLLSTIAFCVYGIIRIIARCRFYIFLLYSTLVLQNDMAWC